MNIKAMDTVSYKSNLNFAGLPARHYPYSDEIRKSSQAEEQMPQIREEIKKYADYIDFKDSTKGIKRHLMLAQKNLADGHTDLVGKHLNKAIKELDEKTQPPFSDEDLNFILYCSMQGREQQDKHDTVWLFNRICEKRGLPFYAYSNMAHVFNKLDKSTDEKEIKKAETFIKDYYQTLNKDRKYFMDENYGFGKIIDFKA